MYFSNKFENDTELKIIESQKLDNNILLEKIRIDENENNVVKLKQNEAAIIFKNGQIFDFVKEEGLYTIKDGINEAYAEDLEDYFIKENNDKLCVIFFNLGIITNNKFYIEKKITKKVKAEGIFDFKIIHSIRFFNKVISVRNYYSREELLEQIRERISKVVILFIKENGTEYKLQYEELISRLNIFEDYGILVTFFEIESINLKKF